MSSVDAALDIWDDTFYLTFKTRDTAERSVLFPKMDQIQLPVNMCFLLCGRFFGFLLLCQHMLCIIMYVIQFISLYFVPLSGLLITSILSLKCNYGHHVMFSMEMHSVQKAGRNPSAWQSFHRRKTKTCSKNGWQGFLWF